MRQRGSSWELRVYLGRDAVIGRKRSISRTFKGGKRDAQRALAALVADADRGALARTFNPPEPHELAKLFGLATQTEATSPTSSCSRRRRETASGRRGAPTAPARPPHRSLSPTGPTPWSGAQAGAARARGVVAEARIAMTVATAALDQERKARRLVKTEAAAQRARVQALRDDRGVLADMEQAFSDINGALERVRAERVVALARGEEPRTHVVGMLAEPPPSVAGRQAWCALAYEIETYRDHHPNPVGRDHEQGVHAAIGHPPSSLRDRHSESPMERGSSP